MVELAPNEFSRIRAQNGSFEKNIKCKILDHIVAVLKISIILSSPQGLVRYQCRSTINIILSKVIQDVCL
jgi:hypothetical protein